MTNVLKFYISSRDDQAIYNADDRITKVLDLSLISPPRASLLQENFRTRTFSCRQHRTISIVQ